MLHSLREACARLVSFFRTHARDRDLDEELATHIELATQEHVRRGRSAAEARRLALIELGGIGPSKERHREARGLPRFEGLVQDVRYAARSLRRSPGFTVLAIATLAVGIGVNAAVFTVANAVLFKGFRSIEGNERILYIGTQKDGRGAARPDTGHAVCCVSYPDFIDWRANTRSFEGLGAVADLRVTLNDTSGFAESATASQVSANTFQLLGHQPILGRDFSSSDETPGAPPVVILRYDFWVSRYGGDPGIVGRMVRINGVPTTVIGVMARGFAFPQNQELWLPLTPTPRLQRREARGLWFAFGRMADGVTFDTARAELETTGRQLASAYPQTNEGWTPRPQTFTEFFINRNAAATYGALWGAVGFVLLIACANLANLMLARAIGKSREVSVRIALGAGSWRIVRQLLIESLMLSAAGGFMGWALAKWAVRAYELFATPPTQAWADHLLDYTMDGRVLAYLAIISLGTGLLFGLAPALRLSKLDVNGTLKDGGRGAAGSGRSSRLSRLVVIAEMALAVVLLAGAGVMVRSFLNIYTANLGINPTNVVTMFIGLRDARYASADAQVAFYDRLSTRLSSIAGVDSVAIANPRAGLPTLPYELAGDAPVDAERRPTLSGATVGPGYFQTLGAAVLAGREFDAYDGTSAAGVVIVNERLASTAWPGADPIGQRLRLFDGATPGAWLTVVGVVSNIQTDPSRGQHYQLEPRAYVPFRQQPATAAWVFVRSGLPLSSLTPAFRREIQALDADLPIWQGPFTLADQLAGTGSSWSIGSHAALFLIFAMIALLLASVGLYAVLAHAVSQRTQEIGVRMAIGGTTRDILALISRQGLVPVGVGLAIGLVLSMAVTRILKAELVDVSPADPVALTAAIAVLIAAALLGCWIPARRAMRVDPLTALRHD